MKKTGIILAAVTVIAVITGALTVSEERVDESAYLNEVVPNGNFSDKGGDPPHYASDRGVVAFNTYDIVPSIRGYAGPIKLLIALDISGEITGIKILEHNETKNYVHYMESPEYLRRFLGKRVRDPFEIGRDIDAISRATVSVEALAKTIKESSRIIGARALGMDITTKEGGRRFALGWAVYGLLFSAAFALYHITRKSKRHLRIRDGFLAAGIVIMGLYLSTPFSIIHIFNLVLLRLSSSVLWYVIVFSVLLSTAVAGRFYCGWLCPFGALSEFIGRLPIGKWAVPVETDDRWRGFKYVPPAVAGIVVFVSRHPEYGNYETYVTLFSLHGNIFTWTLVVLMLIVNVRVERFWCRYLCPAGALTGLLSRKDNGYISGKDCPMANKAKPLISECIRCNRCYTDT